MKMNKCNNNKKKSHFYTATWNEWKKKLACKFYADLLISGLSYFRFPWVLCLNTFYTHQLSHNVQCARIQNTPAYYQIQVNIAKKETNKKDVAIRIAKNRVESNKSKTYCNCVYTVRFPPSIDSPANNIYLNVIIIVIGIISCLAILLIRYTKKITWVQNCAQKMSNQNQSGG